MQLTVAKFQLYPREDPTSYAVGFDVITGNDRSFYVDTTIPMAETEGKIDDEIIALAFEQLKQQIIDRVSILEQRPTILGAGWVPPDQRPPNDPEEPIIDDYAAIKARTKRQFELSTQRFIENLPDGNDRYKWFHSIVAVNMKFSLLSVPEESRTPDMIQVLSRIMEVELWQEAVWTYFNSQVLLLDGTENIEDVYAVQESFDLTPLDATDPNVTLAEIFIF